MEGHTIKYHLFSIAFVLPVLLGVPQWAVAQSVAPQAIWTDVPVAAAQAKGVGASITRFSHVRRVAADNALLKAALGKAPMERTQSPREQIQLPMPDGSLLLFNVEESPIMSPDSAAKYPDFKSYRARAVSDPSISGRLNYSRKGFRGMIQTGTGTVFVDPAPSSIADQYISYYKHDVVSEGSKIFSCGVAAKGTSQNVGSVSSVSALSLLAKTTNELRTYRLAVAATYEYGTAVSGNVLLDTQAEMLNAIDRVNVIFERDLAIHLDLIVHDGLISTISGELANDDPVTLINQAKPFIDSAVTAGAYDIGHVFSTGGGGLAGLGVVCDSVTKADGVTGISNPVGDPFYIDFVAHEIGHQFGANHSFNGTTDSCGSGNRNASTAFEPGSGSTIMSYAGICGAEDVQNGAEVTFHAGSIAEILNYVSSGGGSCAPSTGSGNNAPNVVVDTLVHTIPGGTAFAVSGSASDPEFDPLTYQWDEMDAGSSTDSSTYGSDLVSNALFRSFEPSSSEMRTFPRVSTLLSGLPDRAETLPTENRTLNFRLTVRDGNGGVDEKDMQVVVDGESGPFKVLQPNSADTINTNINQVIEWNSACTELPPVSCDNVDILFSIDAGSSYTSIVGGSTLNDGEEIVSFPTTTAPTAHIKIACVGNIFFDISDNTFALAQDGSGITLTSTGSGGSANCGTAVFNADIEPNDSSVQAQTLTLPTSINGTVNNITDSDDFFVFTATESTYTFTLSAYSTNDLDLLLYNSDGVTLISESASSNNATEKIAVGLAIGKTYYIVVEGFDTFDAYSAYTLNITKGKTGSTTTTPVPWIGSSGGGGGGASYWLLGLLAAILCFRVTANPGRKFIR